jgi:MATE family multidrug resistance protein
MSSHRAAASALPPGLPGLAHELRATLVLGLPLALSQVGQVLIYAVEVVLLGRLGTTELAAVTLANGVLNLSVMFSTGVAQAAAPLIAQARGARQPRLVRRAVRQGLWVVLSVTLPLAVALWFVRPVLGWMGEDPALLPLVEAYIRAAVFGLPAGAAFVVLRSFVSTYGRMRAVVLLTLAAVLVNLGLSWALIFGRLGLPALGIRGAGIGSSLSWIFLFSGMLVYCLRVRPFRRFFILARLWQADWPLYRETWRVGLPIGGALLLETGLFSATIMLMGLIGTAQLAAHQVALQLASLSFMVPLGIAIAATIRVGLAMGRRDLRAARLAGFAASGLGAVFMISMGVLFWLEAEPLVRLFIPGTALEDLAAAALAAQFLRIAALFQLFDGLQVIGISSLRGMKDTAVPMIIAVVGYWLVGFPLAVLLGFGTPLAGRGIWLGLAAALATVAVAMLLRFDHQTRAALP